MLLAKNKNPDIRRTQRLVLKSNQMDLGAPVRGVGLDMTGQVLEGQGRSASPGAGARRRGIRGTEHGPPEEQAFSGFCPVPCAWLAVHYK